jgi:hypothetical protein
VNLLTLQETREKIFLALQHPIRRWIIELLYYNKHLSSFSLANLLHIDLSRCYYHLDNLNGLVSQEAKLQYSLNNKGIRAYQLLIKAKESESLLDT